MSLLLQPHRDAVHAPDAFIESRKSRFAMPRTRNKEATKVLLQALACGANLENAARKAGVSERTAYRRLGDPEFRRQVDHVLSRLQLSRCWLGAPAFRETQ